MAFASKVGIVAGALIAVISLVAMAYTGASSFAASSWHSAIAPLASRLDAGQVRDSLMIDEIRRVNTNTYVIAEAVRATSPTRRERVLSKLSYGSYPSLMIDATKKIPLAP